jgi:hypothetical protein
MGGTIHIALYVQGVKQRVIIKSRDLSGFIVLVECCAMGNLSN